MSRQNDDGNILVYAATHANRRRGGVESYTAMMSDKTDLHARLPKFIIIGAMKSATSTLYEQLLRQPGIYLPQLKEPNFFSDDDQYARGLAWYSGLFSEAQISDILGEASTHYTKLPTYPETVSRMHTWLKEPRLIYIMRDPVDRLISQYIHQWSQGEISCGLDEAVAEYPELVAYSCYARQLAPFIETYGKEAILPIFFERLVKDPQGELDRVCRFIGFVGKPQWNADRSRRNVSAERPRKLPLHDTLIEHPLAIKLRRQFVPKFLRTKIRRSLSMTVRPVLGEPTKRTLESTFDADLAILGGWLGCYLDCRTFRVVTSATSLNWS